MRQKPGQIVVSIVSHAHGVILTGLIHQLLDCPEISKIIITKNIPEKLILPVNSKIHVINNKFPKGFGANHNFAFSKIQNKYFCILNPDIQLLTNPFPKLLTVQNKYGAQLVAPIAINKLGEIEDSIRYFPTLTSLLKKLFFNMQGRWNIASRNVFSSDWIAGMFMLFKSSAYKKLQGFDERFYLYYEDVDICIRLWKAGMHLLVDPSVFFIHDARRASRNNIFHMQYHLRSMAIYFLKYFMRLPESKHFNH